MSDKRVVLEKLKTELGSLEYGRNRRSVHIPWENVSFFQDSVTCLNYGPEGRPYPCGQCLLMLYVPEGAKGRGKSLSPYSTGFKGKYHRKPGWRIQSEQRGRVGGRWLRARRAELEIELAAAETPANG
jgi:hypothetical protein